ncbi:MAG TPA: tetratricopeptide repeat protein [Pyrinomonadaceae bacterium]|jgi:tetratricopeptide (TPR) repeat protein
MPDPTDFELELGRIDGALSEFHCDPTAGGAFDAERATRYVYGLYQRASLKGDLAGLERAGEAIERAVARAANPADLYFLKASLDFKLHRLPGVRRCLDASPGLRDSPQGRALRADLDFQEGRYEEARAGYEDLARDEPTWDNLARLAHLRAKLGDIAEAERLYAEAGDELTAKEMRHFCWLELQLGELDVSRGRFEEARTHYERAGRAYSGYWMVEEHAAELLGALGRVEEAAALYEKVLSRLPRPEFMQALGELYEFAGRPAEAEPWFERALGEYLDSARRGGVHYYHHLADFYSDVREDGAEAVRWARRDLELRENFSTQAALAWALYRDGQFAEARGMMKRSLASGAREARLFAKAAAVYGAAGEAAEAEKYSRMAAEINPRHGSFHVHR